MLRDINNTVNSIRRRQEKDEVFTISAMNSVKTQKLMAVYDIATAVEDITFDEISVIGSTPGKFLWSSNHMEEWHSKSYVDYIQKEFISFDFLRNHNVTDYRCCPN